MNDMFCPGIFFVLRADENTFHIQQNYISDHQQKDFSVHLEMPACPWKNLYLRREKFFPAQVKIKVVLRRNILRVHGHQELVVVSSTLHTVVYGVHRLD